MSTDNGISGFTQTETLNTADGDGLNTLSSIPIIDTGEDTSQVGISTGKDNTVKGTGADFRVYRLTRGKVWW